MDPSQHPLPLSPLRDMKRVAQTGAIVLILWMRQGLGLYRSSCDGCHASPRYMASKWSAEIGWILWWRGQCFETHCIGFSECSIALSSAPCCFKTSVTGGNQDLVPAALRDLLEIRTFRPEAGDVVPACCSIGQKKSSAWPLRVATAAQCS